MGGGEGEGAIKYLREELPSRDYPDVPVYVLVRALNSASRRHLCVHVQPARRAVPFFRRPPL